MGRMVADASPIVYLAKVAQLGLLKRLYKNVVTPSEIRHELLTGDHPEIPAIRDAYQSGWLEEAHLDQAARAFAARQLGEMPSLHEGERNAKPSRRRAKSHSTRPL
jgi:predicted nucleic acid-binding protein